MYKRFLNNNDYIGIITEEALNQLIRGNEERLSQAEEAAEASIVEYLTDNYEVEKELMVGKTLVEYTPKITYPVGAHFYYNGKIYEALRSIAGLKAPTDIEYWRELIDYDKDKMDRAVPYFQLRNWQPGDVVRYANSFYECIEPNGYDFNDIRIPGAIGWEEVEDISEWVANYDYRHWDVVSYEGKFYARLPLDEQTDPEPEPDTTPETNPDAGTGTDKDTDTDSGTDSGTGETDSETNPDAENDSETTPDTDSEDNTEQTPAPAAETDSDTSDGTNNDTETEPGPDTEEETDNKVDLTVNPYDSDYWGLIGDYTTDYDYELKDTEYVVYNNKVYIPTMKVTADELKESYNIHQHDPRNTNIKKHLIRLALYELHKLISPNNISSARITDYETSLTWLRDANRCKINPQIPRKLDFEHKPVAEYAIATYERDYDPNKNPWQI